MDREDKRARCAYGQGKRPASGLGNSMEEGMPGRLTSRGRLQTDPAELAAGTGYTTWSGAMDEQRCELRRKDPLKPVHTLLDLIRSERGMEKPLCAVEDIGR